MDTAAARALEASGSIAEAWPMPIAENNTAMKTWLDGLKKPSQKHQCTFIMPSKSNSPSWINVPPYLHKWNEQERKCFCLVAHQKLKVYVANVKPCETPVKMPTTHARLAATLVGLDSVRSYNEQTVNSTQTAVNRRALHVGRLHTCSQRRHGANVADGLRRQRRGARRVLLGRRLKASHGQKLHHLAKDQHGHGGQHQQRHFPRVVERNAEADASGGKILNGHSKRFTEQTTGVKAENKWTTGQVCNAGVTLVKKRLAPNELTKHQHHVSWNQKKQPFKQ